MTAQRFARPAQLALDRTELTIIEEYTMTLLILGHLQLAATALEDGPTGFLNHSKFQGATANLGTTVLVDQHLPPAPAAFPADTAVKMLAGREMEFYWKRLNPGSPSLETGLAARSAARRLTLLSR